MPTFDGNCPICGKKIGVDELFCLEWYQFRQWWVARHLVPDSAGTSLEPYVIANERLKVNCARAGYNPETGRFSR